MRDAHNGSRRGLRSSAAAGRVASAAVNRTETERRMPAAEARRKKLEIIYHIQQTRHLIGVERVDIFS